MSEVATVSKTEKFNVYIAAAGLGVALFLNVAFGIWSLSEIFYRVSTLEINATRLAIQQEENRTVINAAVIEETKVGTKIDNLKDILDRLLDRQNEGKK